MAAAGNTISGVTVLQISNSTSSGRAAGFLQQPFHRFGTHIGSAEALPFQNMPFPDAGTRNDPFIRGIHHGFKFFVGQDVGRDSYPVSRIFLTLIFFIPAGLKL
ncbi:MAG: hypothetical protein MZV63_55570 [Marinilabiliales bacterium]|nr:hypothetical protein [Marinilabiliales bacterium]